MQRWQPSPALVIALCAFLTTCWFSVRDHGLVGEVAASWGADTPPAVLVDVAPDTWSDPVRTPTAGYRLGGPLIALDAAQTRPLESLSVFSGGEDSGLRLPLAVNVYTGGFPDWPSRVLSWLGVGPGPIAGFHVLLGIPVLVLVWGLLRRHAAPVAGGAAALWLCCDWSFVFYRKVLAGTEIALLAASVLVIAGLWRRRWAGGSGAVLVLALGVALGLHAKITFGILLVATVIATIATRWDRGSMGAPRPAPRRELAAAVLMLGLFALPMVITWLHHALAVDWVVRSHDTLSLQWNRVFSGLERLFDSSGSAGPAREQNANLVSFLGSPLTFFERSCGADPVTPLASGRLVGFGVLLSGSALAWWHRGDARPAPALLRWLSIATPLAALGLFLANRDLHHLGILAAWIALWGGLATAQLASVFAPPRGPRRGLIAGMLVLPWMLSGALASWQTDGVLATCDAPIVRQSGQRAILDLLERHEVQRLTLADYDLYGVLDIEMPDLEVRNGWGLMSHARGKRRDALTRLLEGGRGGHYLSLQPSAPMIYSMQPSERDVERIARALDTEILLLDRLVDAAGEEWARLYRIGP